MEKEMEPDVLGGLRPKRLEAPVTDRVGRDDGKAPVFCVAGLI